MHREKKPLRNVYTSFPLYPNQRSPSSFSAKSPTEKFMKTVQIRYVLNDDSYIYRRNIIFNFFFFLSLLSVVFGELDKWMSKAGIGGIRWDLGMMGVVLPEDVKRMQ